MAIKRMIFVVVLSVFAIQIAPNALAATDNGTLTVGHPAGVTPSDCLVGSLPLFFAGYAAGLGGYSPTALTGGTTLGAINTVYACPSFSPTHSTVVVSGFTSDPGQGWLTSVTCNGVTLAGASAGYYVYSSGAGQANWYWYGGICCLGIRAGDTAGCSVVH